MEILSITLFLYLLLEKLLKHNWNRYTFIKKNNLQKVLPSSYYLNDSFIFTKIKRKFLHSETLQIHVYILEQIWTEVALLFKLNQNDSLDIVQQMYMMKCFKCLFCISYEMYCYWCLSCSSIIYSLYMYNHM